MAMKETRTVCTGCHSRCGAIVWSENNKITRITGDPNSPYSQGAFCSSGLSQKFIHEDPRRLIHPVKRVGSRGSGEWERITWDEALDAMTTKAREVIEDYGPESIVVGQGTNRTTNDWHQRMNATLGIRGWSMAPTHVCLLPNLIPNVLTMGAGQMDGVDYDNAKTIVMWGVSTMMVIAKIKRINAARKNNGAKVIVIDPRFADFGVNADIYLRPRPGTDGALALGLMHIIVKEELYDADFIREWTFGFEPLCEMLEEWTPSKTSEVTWIPEDQLLAAARMMGGQKPTTIMYMLGAGCMHNNGIQNNRALTCLTALLGPVDVPGGFVFQTLTGAIMPPSVTLMPDDLDYNSPDVKLIGKEEYPALGKMAKTQWPYGVFDAVLTEEPWPVKMIVLVANDAISCYENPQHIAEALMSENLDLLVVKDFYITPTARYADIVLPTADWSERDTIDEGFFNGYLISSPRAVDPPGECWDDWKFFLEWGKRINPELWPWENEREMVLWRAEQYHGIKLTWEEYVNNKYTKTPSWTAIHEEKKYKRYETGDLRPDGKPGFRTTTGLIELECPAMEYLNYETLPVFHEPTESPYSDPELAKDFPLILITGHRLYSFFHSAWTNVPGQRKLYPDPFMVINPEDARAREITEGDWVDISSPRGVVHAKAMVSHEVMPGVVAIPRPAWRDSCSELGLPGYDWEETNPNVLIPATPADPGFGCSPMRSTLCEVVKR